jgi:hypothetical protein
LDIAPQQLTGTRTSSVYGPTYSWNYSYDLSFQNDTLLAQVGVELVGADPGTALLNQWESGVESTWSNHYDVVDGTYLYPILFDLVWVGSSPDETVTVHAGTGYVDMLDWYTTNPSGYPNSYQGVLAAHEVGHMIGLYDAIPSHERINGRSRSGAAAILSWNARLAGGRKRPGFSAGASP